MKKYFVLSMLLFASSPAFAGPTVSVSQKEASPAAISVSTNCADRFKVRPADAQTQLKSANAAVGSGQFDQALKIYERLASAGFSGAMKNLSIMYSEGLGVRKDVARAEYWQKEAEQAAMIDALCMNGVHSQEGK